MRNEYALRAAISTLAIVLASGTARAQTVAPGATPPVVPAAANDTGVGDIVVTAQRREQRLQDTPISVAAISGEGLAQRGVVNIKTLTNFIPNVELTNTNRPTAGGSAYAAWIRGVGTGDYAFPTDPGIGIYVDGVYLARTLGGLLSVADIERIEVLRGPQGTLYGRNTIGGAINVVTATPHLTGDVDGKLTVRAGNYGRADVVSTINLPLVQDKVGLKLSASYFSMDGFGHRILTGEKLNGEDRLVLRGGLLVQLADTLTLDMRGDFSRQRNRGSVAQIYRGLGGATPANVARFNTIAAPSQAAAAGLPVGTVYGGAFALPDSYSSYSTSPLQDDYDIGGGSATFAWSPSAAFNVKSITAYRSLATRIQVDGDNSPFTISTTNEAIHDHQFSQELQFSGKLFGDRVKYLAGLYYFAEDGRSDKLSYSFHGVYEITGTASDARDTFTAQQYRARSYAAFTQEDIALDDHLELSLGARINRDKKDFTVQVTLPQRANAVSIPLQTRSAAWTSFTPRVGLNWKPTNDILVYGSWSTGFKSGGFSNPTATLAAPIYNPEKLTTFELGTKTQWFDNALTFNLAGFVSKWRDIQLNVIVPGPTGGVVNLTSNGGTAKLYGFEAELVARPTRALRLNLGVGYTHNEFTELAAGAVTAGITLGTKLPHVPAWSVTPGLQYDADTQLGHFTLRSDLSYRSDQFLTIADPVSLQKGYALLSARLSFSPAGMRNLELGIEATNLTDHRYLVYHQQAAIFGVEITQPGDPRLIAGTATLRF
ncbi:TonB-dependent receptor [Sphingomonas sp. AR_OL41]|uniref:TonB-dependent receptor n=1 Tax=Sphingomonas sp. AR_OL41 TaxID=3042729 RepID=UPI002480EEE6|nr:TonB-dependent receptor [Sphingomonas sp. AR_OL41]MDH7971921.1 TonB-dependent receptor [Sphingomonas sp. AR_OL41]